MSKYLLFCIVFFLSIKSHATHLVGGEMNYRFIRESNDTLTYEILLTVYRDCYLGVPDFDYPGSILVYEGTGGFLGLFNILGNPKTLLPVEIDDECFVAPADVCVEKKEYIFQGELPVNASGYYLSYQRCCRNTTILNIFDDKSNDVADSGMNLFAFIPPRSKLTNSNPVFNSFPPVAICVDKPLVFDHSARDYDGDSLVYKLCVPTDALSAAYPAVFSGNVDAMPFADVRWRNPYSLQDILGGPEKLKIDSKTGLLTALPDKIGQFAVGVCVEEYRNGVFISETKRDFQFNVSSCGKFSVSSFFTFDTICNSLDVNFINKSVEADKFSWQFGDGTSSLEKDPVHRFPAYGAYNVTLIAGNENGCADTLTRRIVLKEDVFSFQIEDVSVCKGQSALLKLVPSSQTVREVHWLLSPSVYTDKPEYSYVPSKSEEVAFEIYNTSGCIYTGKVNVTVKDLPPVNIQSAPQHIFSPQTVKFSSTVNTFYDYRWETTSPNSSPQSSATEAFIDKDQWVYLTITDRRTGCTKRDSVFIRIENCDLTDEFDVLSSYEHYCAGYLLYLDINADPGLKFTWITEDGIISGSSAVLDLKPDKIYNYSLIAEKEGYCTDTINYQEGMFPPSVSIGKTDYKVCAGVAALDVDLDIRSEGDYILTWGDFGDTIRNQDKFQVQLTSADMEIPLVVIHEDSCVLKDTLRIHVINISVEALATPDKIEAGGAVLLSAVPNGFISYRWYPGDLVTNPVAAQTTATIQETTDFIVVVKDENGCEATDTVNVEVIEDLCDFSSEYRINRNLERNCDGGVLSLNIQSDNPGLKFSWVVNSVVTAGTELTLNLKNDVPLVYYLIVADEAVCIDTIRMEEKINNPFISIGKTDYKVCFGKSNLEVDLNIQSTVDYIVLWGNSDDTLKNEDKFMVQLTGNDLEIPVSVIYNDSCRLNEKVLVDIVRISVEASADPGVVEKGQYTTISARPDNFKSYQWYPEQIPAEPENAQTIAQMYVTTDFILVAKDENGCEATDTVRVEVIDKDPCNFRDDFGIVRNLTPHCDGATLNLSINTSNQELKFKWIINETEITGKELTIELKSGMKTTYQLVIEDNILCTDTIDYEENIKNQLIDLQVTDYKVCADVISVDISLNIQSAVDYQISWGTFADTLTNESAFSVQLQGESMKIPVVVMYHDSCVLSDTVQIDIVQPSIDASAEPVVVQKGKETLLSALPERFVSYQWYPEDIPASPQSAQTVAVIYETTDFIVVAKDENGCEATDTVRVEIIDDRCSEENIFVPTAFTPNGDGVNDIWIVRTDAEVEISVAIYNRWGEKVFESNDIQRGWDGIYNGKMAESGSYAYYLTVICENQLQYFSKGSITLIR